MPRGQGYREPWKKHDEDRLLRLSRSGVELDYLAELFGRTKAACANKVMRLKRAQGVTPTRARKPWTAREEELLMELFATDLTLGEIAAELGRPYQGVANKVDKIKGGRRSRARAKNIAETSSEELALELRSRGWTCSSPVKSDSFASGVVML